MENLKLTQLEQSILTSLIEHLYAEEGFSDVTPQEISDYIKVDIKSVRGGLGSLVSKGIIFIDEAKYNGSGHNFVNLHSSFYYLHPVWSK